MVQADYRLEAYDALPSWDHDGSEGDGFVMTSFLPYKVLPGSRANKRNLLFVTVIQ
jgi:hypothetical protein